MEKGSKVTFITGRTKTGKTHEILRRMAEHERSGERSLYIVPSGYTFEAEKKLAKMCGSGFINSTVCGFFRLGQKILSEANMENAFITEQGRVMVIRRALTMTDLSIFDAAAKQPGFALMCDEIISNFVTYELSPDDILASVEGLDESNLLRRKITDLTKVYANIESYLNKTGQDLKASGDMICRLIPQSRFCDAHIYIDGIENPGEHIYRIIEALLTVARSVTFAFRCEGNSDIRVFERERRIYSRLRALVKENGYSADIVEMKRDNRYTAKALEHMERELWCFPMKSYAGDSSNIELFAAPDIKTEVEQAAARVIERAKSGVRYRNMAVVAACPEKYDVAVRNVFSQLNIPIFSDNRLKLSATNASLLIKYALSSIYTGYRANEVISLIKTGLSGIEREEAERFENYVYAYGISGSDFLSSFKIGDMPETVEDTRKKLIEPLRRLQSKLANACVSEKVDALIDYLSELNTEEKLNLLTQQFMNDGKLTLTKQYEQVWGLIGEVLTQLKNVMGEERFSNEKLASIIEEGLTSDVIGVIPSSVDRLNYSGITTEMPDNIDYLFVLGAVADDFPTIRRDDNIIDDNELESLRSSGLNVWLSVESKREQDEANIYKLLCTPDKGLYISYPINDNGQNKQPAPLLNKLCTMLNRKCDTELKALQGLYTRDRLAGIMRKLADNEEISEHDRQHLSLYLKSNDDMCNTLTNAIFFDPSPSPLDKDMANRLYENRSFSSVTRLEKYNSCPFSHFITYGLRAQPKKVFRIATVDEGSFCHEIIDAFIKYVLDNGIDYKSMSDSECDTIIDIISSNRIDNYNNGIFARSNKHRAKIKFLIETARDTIKAIIYHMRMGKFKFVGTEVSFGYGDESAFPPLRIKLSNGNELFIAGKIDRIDGFEGENNKLNMRIVDYKKGGQDFNFNELYAGIKIQLPVYLEAASQMHDLCNPVGMYYMPMTKGYGDDWIKVVESKFKLCGITLNEVEVIKATNGSEEIKRGSAVVKASNNAALPKEKLDAVRRFAVKKAAETAERIISGCIDVSPMEKPNNVTSCEHCRFNSICMFDNTLYSCKYRRLENADFADIFDEHI